MISFANITVCRAKSYVRILESLPSHLIEDSQGNDLCVLKIKPSSSTFPSKSLLVLTIKESFLLSAWNACDFAYLKQTNNFFFFALPY